MGSRETCLLIQHSAFSIRLSGVFSADGEFQAELGADAGRAADVDGAAVGLGYVFDDGEAEAGAAHFARAGAVDAVEALKDAGEVMGRDSEAVVGDLDLHAVALACHGHADLAA